jgi:hypothetical protein
VLAWAEAEEARSAADRLIGAVRAGRLGAAGVEPTRDALATGQADILLLSPIADLEPAVRRELVRLAARTRAYIELVESHAPFEHLGGVGALLRYQHRP